MVILQLHFHSEIHSAALSGIYTNLPTVGFLSSISFSCQQWVSLRQHFCCHGSDGSSTFSGRPVICEVNDKPHWECTAVAFFRWVGSPGYDSFLSLSPALFYSSQQVLRFRFRGYKWDLQVLNLKNSPCDRAIKILLFQRMLRLM